MPPTASKRGAASVELASAMRKLPIWLVVEPNPSEKCESQIGKLWIIILKVKWLKMGIW
jgi:hypothetical protein